MKITILLFLIMIRANSFAQIDYYNIPLDDLSGLVKRLKVSRYSYNEKNDSLVLINETLFTHFFNGDIYDNLRHDTLSIDTHTGTITIRERRKNISCIPDSIANYDSFGREIKNITLFKFIYMNYYHEKATIIFDNKDNILDSLFQNNTTDNYLFEKNQNQIIEKWYSIDNTSCQTCPYYINHYVYDSEELKKLIYEFSIDTDEGMFDGSTKFSYNIYGDLEYVIETDNEGDISIKRYEYKYDNQNNWITCKEYWTNFSELYNDNSAPSYIYKREIEYK